MSSIQIQSSRELGASLLEVLIAIVIMSFGLLALGGLTAASVQYGKMAQFQTVGVQLAADIADRMRANVDGFMANSYNRTSAYSGTVAALTVPTCAIPAKCTPAEVAAVDVAEWRNSLRLGLPGGDAFVLRDAATPLTVDVWVMWTDPALATGLSAPSPCPAAAIAGLTELPRCLYFRAAI
jgi:type IV pilus assembly protein PilV